MNGRVTRPRTDTTASDRDRETKGATSPALGPTEGAYPSSPGQQQSANAAAQETLSGRIPQPIGEPELLALVVDLRLRAGRSPSRDRNGREGSRDGPTPGASGLAPANSASDTLDLCHRRIETVPEGLVGIIRDDVVRLAIGYNIISRLPSNFSQLARLRYLNIRANMITVFPSVLCELPSLEILDISRNKIRKLPSEPGSLLNLRVLSISSNRLRRLPAYITQMRHLRILKLDQNPIEWPPPHVLAGPGSTRSMAASGHERDTSHGGKKRSDDKNMLGWIAHVKAWVADSGERKAVSHKKGPSGAQENNSDDELGMDSDLLAHPTQSTPAESLVSDPYASPPSPSARGYSAAFFGGATGLGHRTPILADTPTSDRLPSPPPPSTSLHPSPVPPLPGQISPRISPLLATNPQLTNADLTTVSQAQPHGALEGEEAFEASTKTHARNNSHSIGQPLHSSRSLKNKKSLPDLRQNHAEILSERQASMAATQVDDTVLAPRRPSSAARRPPLPQSVSNPGTSSLGHVQTAPIGLPPSGRKFSLPTASMAQAAADAAASSHASRSSTRNGVVELETRLPANEKGNPGSKGVAPVDVERNSYFRRLSTLPPSTISKAVPVSVLKFIDATRGVLFALSQIYTALKQYILFATDDRISGQFNRVLDIASDSMAHFINALDRFDSLSRRGTPEPCVIRGVLSACRESVGTFRKVVSVLQLQLRALQNSADVRFTRTLLLMLYGSMAEVGNSWQAMAPQVDAVLPFLAQGPPTSASAKANLGHVTLAKGQTGQPLTAPTLPSIAESTSPVKSQRSPATFQRPPRRRHAGSFSAHDVALGASIPPSAPAAQSFSLEELQASGSRSVRGRVGPPGNLGPLPVQPATAGPLSNSSFKDLFNHLDSLPPTPTVPVTPTSHPSYAFPGISQTPPPVPHPPHSRSATAGNESPARPNRSGSNGSSGDGNDGRPGLLTPLTAGGHPHAPNKLVMDAHLLELVHQVTSTALSVWSALLEHLASVGLKGAAGTTVESSISSSTLNLSTPGRGRVPRTNAQAHEQTGAEPDNLVSGSPRKLKDLRELAVSTGELTRRLQDTLKKVKEEEERSDEEGDVNGGSQGQPSVGLRKLWDESNQFVRAIIQISTLIKAVSLEHAFPRELLRSLGELTSGCTGLMLHMHFLNPQAPGSGPRAQPP